MAHPKYNNFNSYFALVLISIIPLLWLKAMSSGFVFNIFNQFILISDENK